MSLSARLQFGDNVSGLYSMEYMVTDFKCHVVRRHNEARPDGVPRCESMELAVVVPGKDDLNLYEWYVDQSSQSGRVIIELTATAPNQPPQWKEIMFENAFCFSVAEQYNIGERIRRSLRLGIVAEELTVDTIVFNPN